jgi:rare lipoprotein A
MIAIIVTSVGCALLCGAQQASNDGYRQEGLASYYGDEYNGQNTASGEKYDATKFTAAHPTLPFGTILTVTNTQNNKQVVVRVNDRGPFKDRIIDVSKAAAEQLDMLILGTVPVVVEGNISLASPMTGPGVFPSPTIPTIPQQTAPPRENRASSPTVARSATAAAVLKPGIPPAGTGKHYRIQVGAYDPKKGNIGTVFDKLKSIGLNPAYEKVNEDLYRVVLAGINADDVPLIAEKLGSAGFWEALIREEP